MSTTTESPFSLTIKVGPNNDLLTGRADTADEMEGRIHELKMLAALMQGATQAAPVAAAPAAPTMEQAVATVTQAMPGSTVVEQPAAAIEQKEDRWGNKYTRGLPDAGVCQHGQRIVKNGTNKAGRAYKAYVCVNDSPFGDYKQGKCDIAWPPR